MEEKKVKKLFILNIIMMTFSTIISVYAASYLFESEQVSYDNTSSGLTSTNVQDSLDELYNHATDYTSMDTRVSALEDHFQNNTTSKFQGNMLNINSTNSGNRGLEIRDASNLERAYFYYSPSNERVILSTNGQGPLYIQGNPVKINGSEVAKKPVAIGTITLFTSSTTLAYTGVSYTVPANSFYFIKFTAVYSASQPTNIGISTSSTTFLDQASGLRGIHNADAVVAGKTGSGAVTYYVWATYGGVSQNRININGFYIPD